MIEDVISWLFFIQANRPSEHENLFENVLGQILHVKWQREEHTSFCSKIYLNQEKIKLKLTHATVSTLRDAWNSLMIHAYVKLQKFT